MQAFRHHHIVFCLTGGRAIVKMALDLFGMHVLQTIPQIDRIVVRDSAVDRIAQHDTPLTMKQVLFCRVIFIRGVLGVNKQTGIRRAKLF